MPIRYFERFYQTDGSSSRKFGSVGLGLSICKTIIEKHNGTINTVSDEKGSTFMILLPKKIKNLE
ncbi:MAG TPA: ATP-binding protein [Candidatus Nanoarchaeia archaeon]|nr:ATP-binding protein [Candidatus Nanoarchaeia archaeon]